MGQAQRSATEGTCFMIYIIGVARQSERKQVGVRRQTLQHEKSVGPQWSVGRVLS